MTTSYRITAQDILCCAVEIIENHGWERGAFSHHGPKPRCIRAALSDAWKYLSDNDPRAAGTPLHEALRRVSEAIYGPRCIGGIMDWEYRKRTDQAKVLEILGKAADLAKGTEKPETPQPKGGAV